MKILLIIVSRIGDTLFVTPSMRAIKQKYPDSELTVLGHPKRYQVLEHLPFIDKLGSITKKRALFRGYLSNSMYDLAFVYGFDTPLVSYAIRTSKKVISFTQKDYTINKSLYKKVHIPKINSQHVIYQLAQLIYAIGLKVNNGRISYNISHQESLLADKIINNLAKKSEIKIGLQISGFPTKKNRNWPVDNFVSLGRQLINRHNNIKFILFGSHIDKQKTDKFINEIGDASYSLAGKYSLRESAAIMSKTDLYIGVDTGPTHIVSAFNIPIIALYRSTCPHVLTGILDHPHYYPIDHPQSCNCNTDMPMDQITVKTVFDTVIYAMREARVTT